MHSGFISFYFSLSTILFAEAKRVTCHATYLLWGSGLLLLFCCTACQSSQEAEEHGSNSTPGREQLILQRAVTAYDLPNGQPIATLQKGQLLLLTNEISPRLYPQSTRKDTLLEPFLRVILPNKELAWVYADPANFVLPTTKSPLQWQWHNRLSAIFNTSELVLYQQIWDQWANAKQAGVLLLTFQAMRTLRDQLAAALVNYPLLPAHQYEKLFPATLAYQSTAGPGWWIDFNQWVNRCATVEGAHAELALFQFYQKEIYPPDGIEYHFHSWDFPITIQQKHSLLGRHIHYNLLIKLDQLVDQYPFLQAECEQIKNLILDDISTSVNTYWEDWPTIQAELDTILNTTTWNILSKEDLATIMHRRQTLALPNMQELYLGKRNK